MDGPVAESCCDVWGQEVEVDWKGIAVPVGHGLRFTETIMRIV